MRIGKGIPRGGATILFELIAATVPAVFLPPVVSYFPSVRWAAIWTEARLPAILITSALAAGVLEGILSFSSRNHWLSPGGADRGPGFSIGGLLLPAVATLVFLLPLLRVWSFAMSDGGCAFGIFPWSDGGNYYRGAQELLETGTLDSWNCRRPLNAVLLSVRLALSGGSLRGALLLQCILLSYAVYLFVRTVAADLGRAGGLLAFAVVFVLGRKYVHWSWSESLGLTLGALAFALLWAGARDDRGIIAMAGIVVLTIALNARAGAFLVLPALVLWAGFAWRKEKFFRAGLAGIAVGCVLAGFLLNISMIRFYGGKWGVGHGNFSLTLYGLASGKPGWQRIYEDFPESRGMHDEELGTFSFDRAAESFLRDPASLAEGFASSYRLFLRQFPAGYLREARRLYGGTAAWVITAAVLAGIVRFFLRSRWRRQAALLWAVVAGFLASVPFLWVDGEERVYLATVPALAVLFSCGLNGWKRDGSVTDGERERGTLPAPEIRAVAMAALLVIAAIAGPLVARQAEKPSLDVQVLSGAPPGSLVIRSDSPHISILGLGSSETTFVPRVRREDYLRSIPGFAKEEFRLLSGPGTLFLARGYFPSYSPKSLYDKFVWVLGPPGMADGPPGYLLLEGRYRTETNFFHVESYSKSPDVPL